MTHAARSFGREQAARQMGWYWLLLEACLYMTGATIYAVGSFHFKGRSELLLIINSFDFRSALSLAVSISGEILTSCFIFSLSSERLYILWE